MAEFKKIGGRQIPYRGHEVVYEVVVTTPHTTEEIKGLAIAHFGLEPDPSWYHVRVASVYKTHNDNVFQVITLDPYKD